MKSKRSLLRLMTALLTAIMLLGTTYASAAPKRLQGGDRYETAIEISKAGWPETSTYAVLANGENYPDALCAGPLASMFQAPILLTGKDTLDSRTKTELQRLQVEEVFIVGGTGVVSTAVESQLKGVGIGCERIAGADRYETSIKIAEYMCETMMAQTGDVYVVNGEDYADAISVSPIAANNISPIILACPMNIPAYDEYIKSFIGAIAGTAYIVGGSDIVRESVANLFPVKQRITGSDKYQRNAAVINYFADKIDFTKPYVATGETFPDALAGLALIAGLSEGDTSPIILAGKSLSSSTVNLVKQRLSAESDITILGGTGAVSDSTLQRILDTINGGQVEQSREEISFFEIYDSINQGQDYTLPYSARGMRENGSNIELPVTWSPSVADTSTPGTYTFKGTVDGYDEEVILTLEVIEVKQSSNTNIFPDFKSVDFDGNEVTNSFFAQHKLTLVNFWFPG